MGAVRFKEAKGAPLLPVFPWSGCSVSLERGTMRILHVEDDEDTRTLVAFILQAEGWDVVSVDNTSAAIGLAAAGGFDLYILDNRIDGDTDNVLCRGLRSVDPKTPILFYSGAVFPREVETALGTGAQAYLEKPSTPEALVEAIWKLTRL